VLAPIGPAGGGGLWVEVEQQGAEPHRR
jgi:hypothetical protein